jgi:hypothetical protein
MEVTCDSRRRGKSPTITIGKLLGQLDSFHSCSKPEFSGRLALVRGRISLGDFREPLYYLADDTRAVATRATAVLAWFREGARLRVIDSSIRHLLGVMIRGAQWSAP